MIVCDRFVFVHLHKSGGTFVNQLLLQCLPSARQIGYHLPYRELPAEYRSLPVLGTVRNPWAYYLSWYSFQEAQARPNPLFALCSEDRTLGFAETVRNLLQLSSDPARLERLREALPDGYKAAGLNLTKRCLDDLVGREIGFYSFLYQRMYRGAEALTIVPAEDLRGALRGALAALGALPNPRVDLFLDHAPPLNVSRHGPYRDYYDEALRDLVARLDGPLIAEHSYSF